MALGGSLIPVTLWVAYSVPEYIGIAMISPLLLSLGCVSVYQGKERGLTTDRNTGVILNVVGFILTLTGMVGYILLPTSVALSFILLVPAVAGAIMIILGSGLLANYLRISKAVPSLTAGLLGLGAPVAFIPYVSTSLGNSLPTVLITVSGVPYAIGWILFSRQLLTGTLEKNEHSSKSAKKDTTLIHSIIIGSVGAILGLFIVMEILPFDSVPNTPWTGGNPILDSFLLLASTLGLIVSILSEKNFTKIYLMVVGSISLFLAVITLLGIFTNVPVTDWVVTLLGLNLTDVLLYLPVGVVFSVMRISLFAGEKSS
ncbi:hypothetical protein EXE41_11040 [Halorubrum sp. SD690R]|uniref:hypothetical protein n=1 Tax=Halorubrum sp. SD690R TaxID=2518117 RepID=UPI0010F9646A|nr:hypothetical protein [Halorubrum sp. SD690R]TKX45552.1 hypothetical protein EXE41_11040 [Halorubrum sp. SD690R]